ncbi:MAG: HemK2/MTQ2 family protein methyltransferase [Candidatus Altiarchaeota archaeon]
MHLYFHDLKLRLSEKVYLPSDDSYLLAENLDVGEGDSVLDIGTGCGLAALFAAQKAQKALGIDINPHAVELARYNATLNEIANVSFHESDMFEDVHGSFDLITFNPPYLPVAEDDELGKAWAGGEGGMKVIKRFLGQVGKHLAPDGRFLLIVSSLNDQDEVKKEFEKNGFGCEGVASKKVSFEELFLLKGTPTDNLL